ncbi:type II toxin-antitoxin system HicB family antitoxin [Salinarimonas sp.]|uniref:type II toxin-antitoxin system HicB family antitoxin n=1 Tax=Salinarimonas sp. TaxID=2766526 RepID=UPI0032D9809A
MQLIQAPARYVFPALFENGEDGEIIVTFPDLPEAITFGRSEEDALEQAQDCLREALRGRMRDQEDIPQPSQDVTGARAISPPAEMAAKVAVYEAFQRAGMTRVALADRLHVHEGEVRRILDPNHRTKLERLDEAARALGGRLEVTFVPADGNG